MKNELAVTNFLQNFDLLPEAHYLVAVSGGIDSMVLCDLLIQTHLKFAIAHCNFQLRGKDSDADEFFVKNYCSENQIPFYTKRFDVEKFKESGNFSTQMAARELRYTWFSEILLEHSFDYLLTAHHLNDSLETFFINLLRGSGINGLTGIKTGNSKILRPLLPYSKSQILRYANENKLKWREDSSNVEMDYKRNKIRHQIIPILEEIQPQFLANFSNSIRFLKEDNQLISNHIEHIKNELFTKKEDCMAVSIAELEKLIPFETYLFYLFSEFGFQHPQEIQKLMQSENGEINSKTHRLIKNRMELFVVNKSFEKYETEIELNQEEILEKPLYLKLLKSETRDFTANESLDAAKIKFPLRLRKMKTGDVFFPFGMTGSKKLSKFFKDEKYSKLEKENTWLLVDNEDRIVYVIGKRIDDRFKITTHTHKYLNIFL